VLYIGMSLNGLERPIARNHERLRCFEPGDRLTVYRVAPGQLAGLERRLIREHRPRYNTAAIRTPILAYQPPAPTESPAPLEEVSIADLPDDASPAARIAEVQRLLEAALRALGSS
jgi:hypothetical protein